MSFREIHYCSEARRSVNRRADAPLVRLLVMLHSMFSSEKIEDVNLFAVDPYMEDVDAGDASAKLNMRDRIKAIGDHVRAWKKNKS